MIMKKKLIYIHLIYLNLIQLYKILIYRYRTPCDPNPNKNFAKMDNVPLFNDEGKLNPSITILGKAINVLILFLN